MVSFMLLDLVSLEHFVSHRVIHFFDSEILDILFGQGVHFSELPDACIGLDVEPLSHRQVIDIVLQVIHDTKKQLELVGLDHIGEVESKIRGGSDKGGDFEDSPEVD